MNDVQDRLYRFVDRASHVLEPIPEPSAVVRESVNSSIIADPTDNLILHAILDNARRHPGGEKAMLTENSRGFEPEEVRKALADAGVARSFRSAAPLLGWLRSLPR